MLPEASQEWTATAAEWSLAQLLLPRALQLARLCRCWLVGKRRRAGAYDGGSGRRECDRRCAQQLQLQLSELRCYYFARLCGCSFIPCCCPHASLQAS